MERSFGRIQLSLGSLIYLMVTALICFAALYTQANLLFWTLGLILGAFAVSLVAALLMLNNLDVHRLAPLRGVAGEPLILRYHVTNRSRFACFSVEIIETWAGYRRGRRAKQTAGPFGENPPKLRDRPFGWVLHAGPGQTIQAEAPCWPVRRGSLKFERFIVRSGFPFGILRKVVYFQQPGEVLIYPPLRRLNRQTALSLSGNDISNAKHADRGGGMDEFFGLRPYRPGDNYKLIDWKHSARANNLVSREMAKPRPPRMMILLDLARPDENEEPQWAHIVDDVWSHAQEEAINLAGSLIREAYLHGIHVGLEVKGTPAAALPMNHNPAHRTRLLDMLASLDLTNTQQTHNPQPINPTVIVRPNPAASQQDGGEQLATLINVAGHKHWMAAQPHTQTQPPEPAVTAQPTT